MARVVHTLTLPEGPGPWAAAGGAVWLATPGLPAVLPEVGHLERLNLDTGVVTVAVPVGGDPVSVSVQGDVAWVSSGRGDGTTPTTDANMVVQIQLPGGQTLHRYPVSNPVPVVSDGGRVFVLGGVTYEGARTCTRWPTGRSTRSPPCRAARCCPTGPIPRLWDAVTIFMQ